MPDVGKLQKFLKADHVKDGDLIKFVDAGVIDEREFKQKDGSKKVRTILEMNVELRGGDVKVYSPNSTTIKQLSEAWGTNTENWVGKIGRIKIIEQLSFGEMTKVLVVIPNKSNKEPLAPEDEVAWEE